MNWKGFTLAITLALSLLPTGCEDTVTEPAEEALPTYGALNIKYEADQDCAESGEITAEHGGVVSATGPDEVVYTIEASPGAVGSATIITIIPLRELSICSIDDSHIDTSSCVVGALFEPAGLEFDSTVVLTISYPGNGFLCAQNDSFCIVSIDSACAYYEIIPTTTDKNVLSLACTLTHFSGYGVHDPDYDFLKMQIEKYGEYGRDFPGDDILTKIMSLAAWAAAMGWNDLRDLAWQGAYPILDHLAGEAISNAAADPGEGTLGILLHYLGPAQVTGFADIENRIMQAIDALVMAVATRGNELCGSGDQEGGRTLLVQTYEWACSGLVLETSTKEMILTWLIDCSGLEVLLAAGRSYINTGAASVYDIDGALLTFTVSVLDGFGETVEGCEVTVKWDGSSTWTGSTDGDGIFNQTISGTHMFIGPAHCPPYIYDRIFYAEVNLGGTIYRSSDLPIEVRDIRINSNVSYSYNYSNDDGENSVVSNTQISGAGVGCLYLCDGTLTRSFSMIIDEVWSTIAVGQLEINACNFQPKYELTLAPCGLTVAVLSYIIVDLDYLLEDIILEECDWTGHCESSEGNLCLELPDHAWLCDCDPYSGCIINVNNDGAGTFQYQWENIDSGPNWSYAAQLNVWFTISF